MLNMMKLGDYKAHLLASPSISPVSETKYRYAKGILVRGKTKHLLSQIEFSVEFKGTRAEILEAKSRFRMDLDEGVIYLGDNKEYVGVFDGMGSDERYNGFEVCSISGVGYIRSDYREITLAAGTHKIYYIGTDKAPISVFLSTAGSYTISGLTDRPITATTTEPITIDGTQGTIYNGTKQNKAGNVTFYEFPRLIHGENIITTNRTIKLSYWMRWL